MDTEGIEAGGFGFTHCGICVREFENFPSLFLLGKLVAGSIYTLSRQDYFTYGYGGVND